MIKLEDVNIKYENSQDFVLENINLEIPKNQVTAIIGANGSGKSTLLKAINKQIEFDGKIYIDSNDILEIKVKDYAKNVSFLGQHLNIDGNIKVKDLVKLGRFPYQGFLGTTTLEDQDKVNKALEITKLKHLKDEYVLNLSGGQRQKVWIAMILAQDTDYIFLDEPTSYLDINHQLEVLEFLNQLCRKYDKTIIFSHHDINQAIRYSDNLVVVHNHQIYKNGTRENVITNELLEEVYMITCEVDPETFEIKNIKLKEKNEEINNNN